MRAERHSIGVYKYTMRRITCSIIRHVLLFTSMFILWWRRKLQQRRTGANSGMTPRPTCRVYRPTGTCCRRARFDLTSDQRAPAPRSCICNTRDHKKNNNYESNEEAHITMSWNFKKVLSIVHALQSCKPYLCKSVAFKIENTTILLRYRQLWGDQQYTI